MRALISSIPRDSGDGDQAGHSHSTHVRPHPPTPGDGGEPAEVGGREPAQSVSQRDPDGTGGGRWGRNTRKRGISSGRAGSPWRSLGQDGPAPPRQCGQGGRQVSPGLWVTPPHLSTRATLKMQAQTPGPSTQGHPHPGFHRPLARGRPTNALPVGSSPRRVGPTPACPGCGYITPLWVSHSSVRGGLAGQKPLCLGPGQG